MMIASARMALRTIVLLFLLVDIVRIHCGVVKMAVYEHVVISPDDAEANFTRREAFSWMEKNLKVLRQQAQVAAGKGAKFMLFPEYGITGFDHSRDSIQPFLEDIPDASDKWNPCEDPTRHDNTSVLQYISCTANLSNIYIVANMGDIKPCLPTDRCPGDDRYQFNTNVVFDNKGTLIARYHKRNLMDETPLFDASPETEYVFFDTPYGRFGTVICFDLLHYDPTQILIGYYGITSLLVTSAWNVYTPFVTPVQMYSGLTKRNQINVAVSNIRHKDYFMAGSGIFGPGVDISSVPDYENPSGELLVGEIDTSLGKGIVTQLEPITTHSEAKEQKQPTHTGMYDKFGMPMTFGVLSELGGSTTVCSGPVCCVVQYQYSLYDPNETFVLGASDIDLEYPGKIHMQFCAVHRCASRDIDTCGESVYDASTIFSRLYFQAFFDTSLVFPFVSSSPFGNLTYFTEMTNYQFDPVRAIIKTESLEHPLVAAVIFNSVYAREQVRPVSVASLLAGDTSLIVLCLLLVPMIYNVSPVSVCQSQ